MTCLEEEEGGAPTRQRDGRGEAGRCVLWAAGVSVTCVCMGGAGQGLHPGSAGVCSAHRSVKWPRTGADNKAGLPYNGSSRGPPL